MPSDNQSIYYRDVLFARLDLLRLMHILQTDGATDMWNGLPDAESLEGIGIDGASIQVVCQIALSQSLLFLPLWTERRSPMPAVAPGDMFAFVGTLRSRRTPRKDSGDIERIAYLRHRGQRLVLPIDPAWVTGPRAKCRLERPFLSCGIFLVDHLSENGVDVRGTPVLIACPVTPLKLAVFPKLARHRLCQVINAAVLSESETR